LRPSIDWSSEAMLAAATAAMSGACVMISWN